jgi:hypothetical protein
VQQAESSTSRQRRLNANQHTPSVRHDNDASVHQPPHGGRNHANDHGTAASVHPPPRGGGGATTASVHDRLGHNRDARNTLNAHKHGREEQKGGADHRYNPRCGGRYDNGEDWSLSPPPPGPHAFGRHILEAAFLPQYRPPTNVQKYARETNPGLWLEDYRLACQASSADSDSFIIHNLPLYLAESAQTWPEHLPPNKIQSWADLRKIFVGTSRACTRALKTPRI